MQFMPLYCQPVSLFIFKVMQKIDNRPGIAGTVNSYNYYVEQWDKRVTIKRHNLADL